MGFYPPGFFRSGGPKTLVNAGPTVRVRRERLRATFWLEVGMFVFDLRTESTLLPTRLLGPPVTVQPGENSLV
jgi:hypothetical protein